MRTGPTLFAWCCLILLFVVHYLVHLMLNSITLVHITNIMFAYTVTHSWGITMVQYSITVDNNTSNIFLLSLLAVKTLQLNVLLIVGHCRRQGGREVLTPQYISILFIICIHSIKD